MMKVFSGNDPGNYANDQLHVAKIRLIYDFEICELRLIP